MQPLLGKNNLEALLRIRLEKRTNQTGWMTLTLKLMKEGYIQQAKTMMKEDYIHQAPKEKKSQNQWGRLIRC